MAVLLVLESFAFGVLIHMASICGCTEYMYVVSTVSWTRPPHEDARLVCNLGSLTPSIVNVQLYGEALTAPLYYTIAEYEVISVELNLSTIVHETDIYEAPVVVNSTGLLAASVLVESQTLVASYLLIPVEAWGKSYIILALQLRQSLVHVLGGETSTNVTLTLRVTSTNTDLDAKLRDHDITLSRHIPSFHLWVVPFCGHRFAFNHTDVMLFRGSNPFGLIVTNCYPVVMTHTDIDGDDMPDARTLNNHHRNLASMALPVELIGREYVVLGRDWIASSHVMLVSTVAHTVASVSGGSGDVNLVVYLSTNESSHKIQAHRSIMIINSTQPIYVYVMTAYHYGNAVQQLSHASQEDIGLPSLSISLPVSLFFHTYVWRTPSWHYTVMTQHIIIIIHPRGKDELRLNNKPLNRSDWTDPTGSQNWAVGMFPVSTSGGARNLLSGDWMTPFGCYIKLTNTTDEADSRVTPAGYNSLRSHDSEDGEHRSHRGKRRWTPKPVALYRRNVLELINCSSLCKSNSYAIMQAVCAAIPSSYNYPCDYIGKRDVPFINKTVPCPWKTICPEDCPVFKWGYNCTETCPNCEVDCDKFNGECEDCTLGYTYSDDIKRVCDKVCPKNTYGKMCKFKCHEKCGQDCTERAKGTCPACKSLKWGFGCKENCPLNCEGECTKDKGHCSKCKAGFMSEPGGVPLCQLECPEGSHGADCKEICSQNCDGICDRETGACDKCKKGFTHSPRTQFCDLPCPPMRFGKDCKGSCADKCGAECLDKVEGKCPECKELKWGPGCAKACPLNCQGRCDHFTGECEKCIKGFLKDSRHPFCDKECDSMHYGENCEGSCELKCGRACGEKMEGTCKPCEAGTWGFGCQNQCSKNCFDECDNKTGDCKSCKPGFRNAPNDNTCLADCPPMTFGLNCKGSCKEKCQGQECVEKVLGLCINCPERKWGNNCTHSCGENCKDDCNKGTGECKVCNPGYTHTSRKEPFCQLVCPPMTFGNNCEGNCMETCGGECLDKAEGKCPGFKTSSKIVAGIIIFMVLLTACVFLQGGGEVKEKRSDLTTSSTSTEYPRSSISDAVFNDSKDSKESFGMPSRYGSEIDDSRSIKSKKSRASTVSAS